MSQLSLTVELTVWVTRHANGAVPDLEGAIERISYPHSHTSIMVRIAGPAARLTVTRARSRVSRKVRTLLALKGQSCSEAKAN